MDEVFGPAYSRSLATDLVLADLGGRTVDQALSDGERPVLVWEAVCEATGQSEAVRWLHRAPAPKGPRTRPTRR